jgi:hypothetical protein
MEMIEEYGLKCMGENDDDEDEDDNDEGNTVAPPVPMPPAAALVEINDEVPVDIIPEQEAPVPQ